MKTPLFTSLLILPILALCAGGCREASPPDATGPLASAFESAEPDVQQLVRQINSNFAAENYTDAARSLASLVGKRRLTDEEKEAVGVALLQINQAIADDQSLDTREMYDLRVRISQSLQTGSRF